MRLLIIPIMVVASLVTHKEGHSQDFAAQRKAVIDTLLKLVDKRYVYPDVAQKMTAYVRKREQQHAYDTIRNGESLARILTADLRSVSRDNHLGVEYSSSPIPQPAAEGAPREEDIAEFRRQGERDNFAFKKMEILEGNVGYLKLNTFWPADWIKETAAGAMAFLANADAVILDLSDNHGFADGGLLISSYFFNEPTHLSDYINRDDETLRQSWTLPVVPGRKLDNKKLYIIISNETFSAPEDFTYNLQARKRAIVVGETSGGGAHGTRAYRLNDHFTAGIPHVYSVNPVTKGDWEGTGIKPDIAATRQDALRVTHISALKAIVENEKNSGRAKELQEILNRLNQGSRN